MDRCAIVTGGAGFIGSHVVDLLMAEGGWQVTVLDNFDPTYPKAWKMANIAKHVDDPAFRLIEGDILDDGALDSAFKSSKGRRPVVLHFAARTGVRSSMDDPLGWHRVNVTGTLNLLEHARHAQAEHFILASSSSVYGVAPGAPWREEGTPLRPISPYAATKAIAEDFLRTHARLHGLKSTALRLFTAYGPRQRPDLAVHAFFRAMECGKPLRRFGEGSTARDHTYVGDIVQGVRAAIDRPVDGTVGRSPCEVFNLGHAEAVTLNGLISEVECASGRKAIIQACPEQPGDVPFTCADITKARTHLGYAPGTPLRAGLQRFAAWYAAARPALA